MKIRIIAVMAVAVLMSTLTFGAEKKVELKSQMDKVSYAIGTQIGSSFKQQQIDINMDALIKGIKDAVSGSDLALTEDQVRETMMAFQQEMMAKAQKKQAEDGKKNAEEGKKFLEENKKKEGVVTLPSGLQYKVVKKGTGASPKITDTVKTHYRGRLINGEEFDSSHKRGRPAEFPVTGVIKGWTEALQLMKEGDKWELYIPGDLAYGPRGSGPMIGPNATLVFEIELIEVVKPEAKTPPKQ